MKKVFVLIGSFAVIAIISAGCASTSKRSEAAELYKKFQSERPEAVAVQSGDAALDATAKASAKVYDATIKYLNEYISKTENNRQYVGFVNEVQDMMNEDKNLTEAQATVKALEAIKESDRDKPEADKNYERVLAGYKAVEALKPAKKIESLAPLGVEAAEVATKAKNLSSSFKGFDAATLQKAKSAKNVLDQAEFTAKALDFLNVQYRLAGGFENYMK